MTLKIVYMGTPEFAIPALQSLHAQGYDIALVVTQPDRPKGRGRKLIAPPVKQTADALGYRVIQPESIKTSAFKDQVDSLKPDVIVVVAFGQILPEAILNIPGFGAINIHASLLPKYRGAAPIQRAVINGETETGVTTMFMDKGLDTGDILLSSRIPIWPDDTSDTLHDRLADLGANLLIRTLQDLESGNLHPTVQNHANATYAPLLKKSDGHIDWTKPAELLASFIRGMNPWPGAFTFYGGSRLKILKATSIAKHTADSPGTVLHGFPDELVIATGKSVLSIIEIQGASGKRLLIKDFLRGHPLVPGTVLT